MSENNGAWASLMKSYYSNKVTSKHNTEINTDYGAEFYTSQFA